MSTPNTSKNKGLFPSDASEPGRFDRFATAIANTVARPWFFFLCVLLVLIWAPSYFILANIDTWQLIINTATTIITFLLVALLQNTQSREDKAIQRKLNAIAEALAVLIDADNNIQCDVRELRAAIGLEHREGS